MIYIFQCSISQSKFILFIILQLQIAFLHDYDAIIKIVPAARYYIEILIEKNELKKKTNFNLNYRNLIANNDFLIIASDTK